VEEKGVRSYYLVGAVFLNYRRPPTDESDAEQAQPNPSSLQKSAKTREDNAHKTWMSKK
jgi:hypothetical protein